MAKWQIEVEVHSSGSQIDVELGVHEILKEHAFRPGPVKAVPVPEPLRLADYPARAIRPSTGSETYRIVIPGLTKDGQEVTVQVWEDDVDPELLAHVLGHDDWE